MKRKTKNFIRSLLLALLLASLSGPLPAYATNSDIAASRKKINSSEQELKDLKNEQYKVKEKLGELSKLKDDTSAYITKLDGELSALDDEIAALDAEIASLGVQIEESTKDLAAAEETERQQYASMKQRIRYMYENGETGFLNVVLEAGSLSEVLNKAEYVQRISEYDRQKLEDYAKARQTVADLKARLEQEQADLGAARSAGQERREAVAQLEEEKKNELAGYSARISEANAQITEMDEKIKGIRAAIQAEENNIAAIERRMREQEAEAKRLAEARGEKYVPKSIGNISFTWPCPASHRITSGFGKREAPLKGASTTHKGIDIGAPTGEKVIAAASGSVVIATYSSSAGNYIMLSHGGGVYTVYMHLSKMNVSVGDEVSKGSTIGKVGSTGNSTGPHLHFGIRVDGSYVDPSVYVG